MTLVRVLQCFAAVVALVGLSRTAVGVAREGSGPVRSCLREARPRATSAVLSVEQDQGHPLCALTSLVAR